MVITDLEEIFLPLPDDLLVNLSDSRNVVDTFLDSLPSMFQGNVNVESAFGPALKAAYMVMVCGSTYSMFYLISLLLPRIQIYLFGKSHRVHFIHHLAESTWRKVVGVSEYFTFSWYRPLKVAWR